MDPNALKKTTEVLWVVGENENYSWWVSIFRFVCTHCMVSTGLKCNHNQVCGGMRVEGGWKSLIGIVVGEN